MFHELGPKVSDKISSHLIDYIELITQSYLISGVLRSITFHVPKKGEL